MPKTPPPTTKVNPHRHQSEPKSEPQSSPPLLLKTFSDGLPVPKVLVFDLDYTLWPFWVDTHVSPPLKKVWDGNGGGGGGGGGGKERGRVVDSCNESFTFYPSVPDLLLSLNALPQPPILAIASRSSAPRVATTLLKKLQLHPPSPSSPASSLSADAPASAHGSIHAPAASATKQSTHPSPRSAYEFFDHVQIFPGDKKGHFTKIRDASGVKYEDMVFFDDEARNRNVEALGVVMLLVENGVSAVEVDEGVREWRRRKGKLRNGKSGASVWGKEEGGEDE